MNVDVQLALLLWGTLVGLDLVSVPQIMIARPLVAGAGAGLILGDLPTGLRLGVLFAQRMAAFGTRLIAYDPYVQPARAAQLGVRLVGLEELDEICGN